jgi:hypothetical protein
MESKDKDQTEKLSVKEYNSKYYKENKAKILQHMGEKIPCVHCQKLITKQHMPRHIRTSSCKLKQIEVSSIEKLQKELKELKDIINKNEKEIKPNE